MQHTVTPSSDSLDIETFRPLVAKAARHAWIRLPRYARGWIELDDMVQDGVLYANTAVLPKWNPNIGVQFGLYLHNQIWRYFADYLDARWKEKRFHENSSFEALTEKYNQRGMVILEDVEQTQHSPQDASDYHDATVHAFQNLYQDASPELQSVIEVWLFALDRTHLHLHNPQFRKHCREFRRLAKRHHLGAAELRYLLYKTLPVASYVN